MERRGFQNEENTFLLGVVKTSLGVFIGGLAAMFAYEGINALRFEYAARQLVQQAQQQAQQQQKAARAEALRQQQQQQQIQQQRQEELRAAKLLQRLERERRARKEAAWVAFYQPSASCRDDPVNAVCANEHISAKRRFDAQYVDR